MSAAGSFGRRLRRTEDAALLTGRGSFVADLIEPGMPVMRVIRSSLAHARIRGIDFGALQGDPACIGVLAAADLGQDIGQLPAIDLVEGSAPAHHPVLARELVRYAGQALAVVIARDAYSAEDLAERVVVQYEPLPPVMSVDGATAADAALLYPQFGTNVVHETAQRVGDPDAAFAAAHTILEERFSFQRVSANSMEARGVVVRVDRANGTFVLHSSTQIPQILRRELSRITGIEADRLRVIAPDVGGGFGAKEAIYPEEALALLAAQRFGCAVSWMEDRQEAFVATCHGREERLHLRAALDADGMVTALQAECLADIGAAYSFLSNTPGAALVSVRGPYRIPNFSSRARSVVTNKTPLNVYRGAGYPQTTLAMERLMDRAAATLGIDRAEIRRRNLLPPEAFPVDRGVSYPGCGRIVLDSGNFPAVLDSTLQAIGYDAFAAGRGHMRDELSLGLGLSFVVEMTGGGGAEPARLRVLPDGRLQLLSGVVPIGQGTKTTLAQILADHLGIAVERIEVRTGDTDESPDAPGTFASRGATLGGNAACQAGDALVREARRRAAALLGVPGDDILWKQGVLVRRDGTGAPMRLAELMQALAAREGAPAFVLEVAANYGDDAVSWASACHAAIVEVDRETGIIRVLDYAVTHDCGRLANPLLVDGQVMGGAVQGLGQCLFEVIRYDEAGLPLCSGYMDYVLPTAASAPRFILRHIETPSPLNPLGMKGAGEAGCSGAVAAVANAIADALGEAVPLPGGSGPFTPELITGLLREATARQGSR